MLIHAKAPFFRGSLMLISFLVLFAALLMPILRDENGKHVTGLEYADNVFNELSKGSSYFIPGVRENLKKVDGKVVTITVKLKKAALAPVAAMALQTAGATDVSATDGKVTFTGDLGKILTSPLTIPIPCITTIRTRFRRNTVEKMPLKWLPHGGTCFRPASRNCRSSA